MYFCITGEFSGSKASFQGVNGSLLFRVPDGMMGITSKFVLEKGVWGKWEDL